MHTDMPTLPIGKWTNSKTQVSYWKSSRNHTCFRCGTCRVICKTSLQPALQLWAWSSFKKSPEKHLHSCFHVSIKELVLAFRPSCPHRQKFKRGWKTSTWSTCLVASCHLFVYHLKAHRQGIWAHSRYYSNRCDYQQAWLGLIHHHSKENTSFIFRGLQVMMGKRLHYSKEDNSYLKSPWVGSRKS